MSFSIRLSDEEEMIASSYAKFHSISLDDAFKKALFDRIEDEYDVVVGEEAYQEYIDSGKKSSPVSELRKELEL